MTGEGDDGRDENQVSEQILDVYSKIVKVADYFLEQAEGGLSFKDLQDFDPNVDTIARNMKILAGMVRLMSNTLADESVAINAEQCCLAMERIALAVKNEDDSEIAEAIGLLEFHAREK